MKQVLHARFAKTEISQVPEHKSSELLPVVAVGKDNPWDSTVDGSAHVLVASSDKMSCN